MLPTPFVLLLKKYLRNECSPEEQLQVEQWYRTSGRMGNDLLTDEERRLLRDKIWQKIDMEVDRMQHPPRKSRRIPFAYPAAAAAAALLVFAGWWFRPQTPVPVSVAHTTPVPDADPVFRNTGAFTRIVELPDHSLVHLRPGSRISYRVHAADSLRQVWLEGTAFFEITRNSRRPFQVIAGQVKTRVLGTSFLVERNPAAGKTSVWVKTGKVEVHYNPAAGGPEKIAALMPDEKAVIDEATHHWELSEKKPTTTAHEETAFPPLDPAFTFETAPLQEVTRRLGAFYNLSVKFEDEALSKHLFTGDINHETLFQKLDIICKVTGTRYTVHSDTLFIAAGIP